MASEKNRQTCPQCDGFAVRLCPWCKIDIKDEKGKVIQSKPGQGCRACMGKSLFTCSLCEGKGVLPQDEIEIPGAPNKRGDKFLRDY